MAGIPPDPKAAIERVLSAERDAEADLVSARAQARTELELARDDALTIVNEAGQRIARWQRTHAERLEGRLAAQRSQAEAARADGPPDARTIAAAVDRVAARLTGGMDEVLG